MNLASIKNVYCIGLGGVGVSAVAKYFLAHGVSVSGADPVRSPLVEDVIRNGGTWYDHHDPTRITKNIDLVVYTDDTKPDHPEREAAVRLGIPSQNFSETLGEIMSTYRQRICVAGTNGKSTTTALTGLLLEDAGVRPSVFVGSRVTQFDGNLRLGGGDTFVAEADEYRDHFLNLKPTIACVTNMELDHVDYFLNIERMKQSFTSFVERLPGEGKLVYCADDPISVSLFQDHPQTITFGLSHSADVRITDVHVSAGQQHFGLYAHGQQLGEFTLHIPGQFNVLNVAAAVANAIAAGADPTSFPQTIQQFHGIWRRFQILNAGADVTIISDYAHHPTAVRGTIVGARAFYPDHRIIAVFQPHHHNRLTNLFEGFSKSFDAADVSVIVETYSVPGREPENQRIKTAKDLADVLKSQGKNVDYAASPLAAEELLKKTMTKGDIVLIMGAGDIWRIAEPLADIHA